MLEGQLGSLHKSTEFLCWRHNSQLEWFFFPRSDLQCRGKELQCMCWRGRIMPSVSSRWPKVILAEHLVISAIQLVDSVSYFSLFFILPSYLAKQFMPNNPYFRNPGHFWYDFTSLKQSLYEFISQYLPVGTFLLTAKWFAFFLLFLSHGIRSELHLPKHGFFLVTWRLAFVSSCLTKSYSRWVFVL